MVRAELESLATEVAAAKMTTEDLAELEEAEQRFAQISKELRAREPGEERRSIMGDWVRANHAFHDVIYRVADLPLVEQLAKSARRSFSARPCGRRATTRSTASTRRTPSSTARSARRSRPAARRGAGAAREHVLSSFHMLEAILEQVGGTWPQPKRVDG